MESDNVKNGKSPYERLKSIFIWLFSLHAGERKIPKDKNDYPFFIIVTSSTKYSAAERLKAQGLISEMTVVISSLGLIFIPVLQLACVTLPFDDNLLNAIQIMLATTALIYSIIASKGEYLLRAHKLQETADELKNLFRQIKDLDNAKIDEGEKLKEKYNSIVKNCEHHAQIDYLKTKLDLKHSFHITGIKRVCSYVQYYLFRIILVSPSIILISIEICLIYKILHGALCL